MERTAFPRRPCCLEPFVRPFRTTASRPLGAMTDTVHGEAWFTLASQLLFSAYRRAAPSGFGGPCVPGRCLYPFPGHPWGDAALRTGLCCPWWPLSPLQVSLYLFSDPPPFPLPKVHGLFCYDGFCLLSVFWTPSTSQTPSPFIPGVPGDGAELPQPGACPAALQGRWDPVRLRALSSPLGPLLPLLGVRLLAPEHSGLPPPTTWRTALYTAGAQSLQADQGRSGRSGDSSPPGL